MNKTSHTASSTSPKATQREAKKSVPSNAHPLEVNLTKCSGVSYEKKNGVHGVAYKTSEGDGWTEVVGRKVRYGPRKAPAQDGASSSDEEELVIPDGATVTFCDGHGTPGLRVCTRKFKSWTPIATRTRSKRKN